MYSVKIFFNVCDFCCFYTSSIGLWFNVIFALHGVVTSVDKRIATCCIYLYSCKVFDAATHNIVLSKVKRDGFDGWTIR